MRLAVDIGNRNRRRGGGSVGGGGGGGGTGGGALVGVEVGSGRVSYVRGVPRDDDDDDATTSDADGGPTDDDGCGNGTTFVADTRTAGSVALLLQAALLPGLVKAASASSSSTASSSSESDVSIELRGGTNATGAPQIDYVTEVLVPFLNCHLRRRRRRRRHARGGGGGDDACQSSSSSSSSGDDDDDEGGGGEGTPPVLDVCIVRRGYYPKGGGVVRVDIRSIPPPAATVPRGVKLYPPLRLAECRPMASISISRFPLPPPARLQRALERSDRNSRQAKSTPPRQNCPTSRLRDRHMVCTSSAIPVMTWWESA
jgi:hypothetical protein